MTTFPDTTGTVNGIFWPLSQSGGTVAVSVKESNAATSATNPLYSMNASIFAFNPIGGAVGDAMSTDVPCRNAGTAGLTKATA